METPVSPQAAALHLLTMLLDPVMRIIRGHWLPAGLAYGFTAVLFVAANCSAGTAQTPQPAAAASSAAPSAPAPAEGDAAAPVVPIAPPPTPAATAAEATPAPAAQETVDNPYGLSALWNTGDFVTHGTLVALLIMSMATWYIMIVKLIGQTMLLQQARRAARVFWTAPSIRDGAELLSRNSAFRTLVEEALQAREHHEGALTEQIDLHSWITMSLQRSVDAINNRMQGGLALLATVGSTAPFIGLFGTVWGIYHALTAIGIAGQASIDKVAGPVGEALIMTAAGLAVAVPAVLAYNWMVRRNKLAMEQVRSFATDVHALLIGGAGREATRVAEARPAMRRA